MLSADAFGSVSWRQDVPFITTAVPTGQTVTMFWDLFLEGDISAASARKGDGFATFSINDIGVNTLPGAPYQNGQYWGFARSTADAGFFVLEEIPGGIRVATSTANGAMVRVGYAMTLSGRAISDHSSGFEAGLGNFDADVSGSLHWGGVASVMDLAGNVIPRDQWTFVSDTGFDYAKSFEAQVPEPSGLALLIAAAMCAAGHRKKLRRCVPFLYSGVGNRHHWPFSLRMSGRGTR